MNIEMPALVETGSEKLRGKEGKDPVGIELIDYDKCNDCGVCYDICPMDVFRKLGRKVYISYTQDCMTCYLCEMYCDPDAIYVGPQRTKEIVLPY